MLKSSPQYWQLLLLDVSNFIRFQVVGWLFFQSILSSQHNDSKLKIRNKQQPKSKQESIPVGCVLYAAVTVGGAGGGRWGWGVPAHGGVPAQGVPAQGVTCRG